MRKNKFNNNASLLKKAINNDKLVVFAGAGVSKDSGIPLWNELIEEVKGYLNEDIIEKDPLKIAQILYNEKGEKEYNDIIKKCLFNRKENYNPIHEILFELNPQHIITTNYDNFFEKVIENKGLPFSVVSKDIDLPYAEHKNLLVKYHGDFDNKNIVFKETDYLEFSKNNTLKEIFVKSLFSNKVILFVGYSVGDINLKLLIREIQFILTKHHQRAYLLTHKSEISDSEIKYFENLGINIISYCEESLKILKENDKLSTIGKSIHKQLEHIRDFDLFEYERNKSNQSSKSKIIDDLYSSLNRFYYFRVLPKKLLASLYPLSKGSNDDTIYNIESNTLICYNDELFDLINHYKGKNDLNFSEEDKRKLNFSISRLIHSNIYSLGQKVGNKDILGNQRTGHKIDLFEKFFSTEKKCECIDCTIGRYEYSDAILKIEKYKISDDSELWDDLVYAYSLYQLEEFYKSYKSYEQIEIKANKSKKMEVSFISKYNMKRIGTRILGMMLLDNRYSFEDLQSIEKQANKIDLDKELTKIKYFVDNEVYKFLKEVRDGVYIQRLCNDIDNFFNKIPNDVRIIQRGGSVSNSDYFNLYNAVRQLNAFLKDNFIIGNGFSSTDFTINKSIKTFILGFYIGTIKLKSNQNRLFGISKLESFNHFLFELIIDYSDSKELFNFIKEKGISNIKFDTKSQKSVFDLISNFFKSSFEKNKLFEDKGENELFHSYINYNTNLKKKILDQFKNICIVLNYFEFSQPQLKSIYSDLNQFIKYTDFDKRDEFIYLKSLIKKKYEDIEYDLLFETLNIFNSKRRYDECYFIILKKLRQLNSEFINNGFNIDESEFNNIKYDLYIIYDSLSIENKSKFLQKIENELKNEFDTSTVFVLLSRGLPLKKEITEKYIETIHNRLKNTKKVTKEDFSNYFFLQPILQYAELINLGLINDPKLSSLKISPEILSFIFNPETFDESKFEVEWLKKMYWDSFTKRFSKIEYIINKLERFLIKNEDAELTKIYFRLKEKAIKK